MNIKKIYILNFTSIMTILNNWCIIFFLHLIWTWHVLCKKHKIVLVNCRNTWNNDKWNIVLSIWLEVYPTPFSFFLFFTSKESGCHLLKRNQFLFRMGFNLHVCKFINSISRLRRKELVSIIPSFSIRKEVEQATTAKGLKFVNSKYDSNV